MSNLKLKHFSKKKVIRMYCLIVCSLLISEKTFALWDKECCAVKGNTSYLRPKSDNITIFFKFFEYEIKQGVQNSFLKEFEVKYTKDKRRSFIHLLFASTQDQKCKTWAWIDFKEKKPFEKIELYTLSRTQPGTQSTLKWKKDISVIRLEGAGKIEKTNEVWCGIRWYPGEYLLDNVTHIQITAIWYNHEKQKNENILLIYDITPVKANLISKSLNFSNSSPKQEITTETKSNTVKAFKNANKIVVKGALNETIRVYTTSGTLLKSVVADCDVLQIPVPANQFYVVKVGQGRYKVAL